MSNPYVKEDMFRPASEGRSLHERALRGAKRDKNRQTRRKLFGDK